MSSEFLVDCIMCNWDAYTDCNCLVLNDATFRVDVGGCLQYRAMGEERVSFDNIPDDHESILAYNAQYITFDPESIGHNMLLVKTAFSNFGEFQTNVISDFSKLISKMLFTDEQKTKFNAFIAKSIRVIKQRLEYYRDNGDTILNSYL